MDIQAKDLKSDNKNQCIKYKGENAVFKEHLPSQNKTYIILRGTDWKKDEGIFIDSDEIIDDCTAPLFK